jgi:hypothetical protein
MVEKFKSRNIKKEASFEIYSILTSSRERDEVVKVTVESYLTILDQHDAKMVATSDRGFLKQPKDYKP